MSPSSSASGRVRSAADVNEDIRALLERTRRRLSDSERAIYDLLIAEYAGYPKAQPDEVVKAA